MSVTTFTPESPRDPAHTTVLQASDEQKNSAQIQALLSIQVEARMLLYSETETGTESEMDEEAVDAARETYTAAAHQLRNIIDAQERWTIRQNAVDAKTEQVMDLKIQEHKQRIDLNQKLATPAALYHPKVRRIMVATGQPAWVCWIGGNDPHGSDVHGIGSTPSEAVEAFNQTFLAQLPLSAPPPPEPPAEAPKPARKPRKK